MSKMEEILLEYEKGDINKRLHLYLFFRDLRKEFLEMELKERKNEECVPLHLCRSFLRTVSNFSGQLVHRA
jgi:hypothetical protein